MRCHSTRRLCCPDATSPSRQHCCPNDLRIPKISRSRLLGALKRSDPIVATATISVVRRESHFAGFGRRLVGKPAQRPPARTRQGPTVRNAPFLRCRASTRCIAQRVLHDLRAVPTAGTSRSFSTSVPRYHARSASHHAERQENICRHRRTEGGAPGRAEFAKMALSRVVLHDQHLALASIHPVPMCSSLSSDFKRYASSGIRLFMARYSSSRRTDAIGQAPYKN